MDKELERKKRIGQNGIKEERRDKKNKLKKERQDEIIMTQREGENKINKSIKKMNRKRKHTEAGRTRRGER